MSHRRKESSNPIVRCRFTDAGAGSRRFCTLLWWQS